MIMYDSLGTRVALARKPEFSPTSGNCMRTDMPYNSILGLVPGSSRGEPRYVTAVAVATRYDDSHHDEDIYDGTCTRYEKISV